VTTVRRRDKLANAARLAGDWLRRPQALPELVAYAAGWKSTRGLHLPDFLGIGAQKAGTTWLHQNLRHHPELWFPPDVKEIRYFDARLHRGPGWYAGVFEPAGDRVTGDITPNYGALGRARIRYVHRLLPDARLLLILRNPVERAWSHAVMDLAQTRDRDIAEVPDWELRAHFDSRSARRNGEYRSMLERWGSVFDDEQLLVAFFEDIAERPRELLTRVFRHIGVSDDVDWDGFPYAQRIKPGSAVPIPAAHRAHLERAFASEIRWVAERFGGPAEQWR